MQYVQPICDAIVALGVFSTFVAHLPFIPAKWAEAFARFGVTSQKFSVNQRDVK
jgi:hypothetical protein